MSYLNLLTLIELSIQKVKNLFNKVEAEDLTLYSNNKVKYTICPNGNVVNGLCESCTCRTASNVSKKTEE